MARRLVLPVFPIQGGTCAHTADEIGPGSFGTCQSGDYSFLNGNVGIGTATPSAKLHVAGDIRMSDGNQRQIFRRIPATYIDYAYHYLKLFEVPSQSTNEPAVTLTGRVIAYRGNDFGVSAAAEIFVSRGWNTAVRYSLWQQSGYYNYSLVKLTDGGKDWVALLYDSHTGASILEWQVDLEVYSADDSKITLQAIDSATAIHSAITGGTTPRTAIPYGNVGIGRSDPQAKLHIKGGGVTIEDDMGAGRLGFAETGESDARIVLYRGGQHCSVPGQPDITILRNFPQSADSCVVWTLLKLWAPKIPSGTPDREATISLVRDLNSTDDDSQEFIDLYNNGYHSTGSVQHGIRIQKRSGQTSAQYRDFVFDQYDGNANRTKLQIMTLAADRTVRLRSHGDTTNWAGTDSIHATAVLTTASATQGALGSITLDDGRAYEIVARVVGRKSDGSERVFFCQAVLAYRQGAGAVIEQNIVRDVVTPIKSSGAGSWSCTIDVNGNDVRVRVTGVASTTIYWVATIEYQSVATSS